MAEKILYEAQGYSMWPFLRPKDRLIIEKVPVLDLRCGDVILYRFNNQLVCHRLVKKIKSNGAYLMFCRGDVSVFVSDKVTEDMFLGRVIGVLNSVKTLNIYSLRYRVLNKIMLFFGPLIALSFIFYRKIKSLSKILN